MSRSSLRGHGLVGQPATKSCSSQLIWTCRSYGAIYWRWLLITREFITDEHQSLYSNNKPGRWCGGRNQGGETTKSTLMFASLMARWVSELYVGTIRDYLCSWPARLLSTVIMFFRWSNGMPLGPSTRLTVRVFWCTSWNGLPETLVKNLLSAESIPIYSGKVITSIRTLASQYLDIPFSITPVNDTM